MNKNIFTKITASIIIAVLLSFSLPALADDTSTPTQAQLEQQLKDIELEITNLQKELTTTTAQKNTLANKIKQLKIKQTQLNALIKQAALRVDNLVGKIEITQNNLTKNILKESDLNSNIMEMIRTVNESDSQVLISLASTNGLSAFFF